MPDKPPKADRLDKIMVERGIAPSRERASALIIAGVVLVDERPAQKPSDRVRPDQAIRLKENPIPYVSRGGLKLQEALEHWQLDPTGMVCADIGASTGGFTDCLLQRGATRVYAVDVGYNQLAWKLRQDPRVVVMENTNARYMDPLPEPVDLIVGDVSFISLSLILPKLHSLIRPGGQLVLLIKPQFEVGREGIRKGGRVDPAHRPQAIERVADEARALGFVVHGVIDSPIPGAKAGNIEALMYMNAPAATGARA